MNRVTSQRASGVEALERRVMLDGAGVAAAVPDRFEAEDAELSGVIG